MDYKPILSCEKHPWYKGRKKPAKECTGCLKLWLVRTTPRAPIRPTKVFKDPSAYTRKTKHKKPVGYDG